MKSFEESQYNSVAEKIIFNAAKFKNSQVEIYLKLLSTKNLGNNCNI